MIIYCTSVTQTWKKIKVHANRVCLEKGSGSSFLVKSPAHLNPQEQLNHAEQILADHAQRPNLYYVVASTYELPLLRILKRVRQKSLKAEEVLIHCLVNPTHFHIKYVELRVDHKGEFLDCWPEGFFSERLYELI